MKVEEGLKGKPVRERVACRKHRPSMTQEALHVTVPSPFPPPCAPGPSASLKQDMLELPRHLCTLSPPAWDARLCCLQIPSHPSSLGSSASTVTPGRFPPHRGHSSTVVLTTLWIPGLAALGEQFDTQRTYHDTQYIVDIQQIFVESMK